MLGIKSGGVDKARSGDGPFEMGRCVKPDNMQVLLDFVKEYDWYLNTDMEIPRNARFVQGKLAEHYKKRNGSDEFYIHQSDTHSKEVGLIAIDLDRGDLSLEVAIDREEVLCRMTKDFGAILWLPSKSVKRNNKKLKGRLLIHCMVQDKEKIRAQMELWFWEHYGAGYHVKAHLGNTRWFMGNKEHPSVLIHDFIDEVSFRPSQPMLTYHNFYEVYAGGKFWGVHNYDENIDWRWCKLPAKRLNLYDVEYKKADVSVISKREFGKNYVGKNTYLGSAYGGIPIRDIVSSGSGSTLIGSLWNGVSSMRARLARIGISGKLKSNIEGGKDIFDLHDRYFKEGVLYDTDELEQSGVVRKVSEWVELLNKGKASKNFTPWPNTHYEKKKNWIYWTGSFFKNYHTGENYYEIEKYTGVKWFEGYLPPEFGVFEGRVSKHAPTGSGKNYINRNKKDTILLVPTKALGLGLGAEGGYVYIASTDHDCDAPKRIEDIVEADSDSTIVMTYDKFSWNYDKYLEYRIIVDEVNNLFQTSVSKYSLKRDVMIKALFVEFENVMFMSADSGFQKNVDILAEKYGCVGGVEFEDYDKHRRNRINIVNRDSDLIQKLRGGRVLLYCNSISKAYQWRDVLGVDRECRVLKSDGEFLPEEVDLNPGVSYVFTSAVREGYSFKEAFDYVVVDSTAGMHNSALTNHQAWSRARDTSGEYYVLVEDSQERKDFGIDLYYKYVEDLLGVDEDSRIIKQYFDGYYNVRNALIEIDDKVVYLDTILIGLFIQGQAGVDRDHGVLVRKIKEFGYEVAYDYVEGGNEPLSTWCVKDNKKYVCDDIVAIKRDIDLVIAGEKVSGLSVAKGKKYKETFAFIDRISKDDENGYLSAKTEIEGFKEMLERPRYASKQILMEKVYKAFAGMGFLMGTGWNLNRLIKVFGDLGLELNKEVLVRFFERLKLDIKIHKIKTGPNNDIVLLWSTYKERVSAAVNKKKLVKQIVRWKKFVEPDAEMTPAQYKRILKILETPEVREELCYNDEDKQGLLELINDYTVLDIEVITSDLLKNNDVDVIDIVIDDPLLWFEKFNTPRRTRSGAVDEATLLKIWGELSLY